MRFLTKKNVRDKLNVSNSWLHYIHNPGSKYYDPSFPKPRHLGKRCVRWDEEEINNWMKQPGVMMKGGASCAEV